MDCIWIMQSRRKLPKNWALSPCPSSGTRKSIFFFVIFIFAYKKQWAISRSFLVQLFVLELNSLECFFLLLTYWARLQNVSTHLNLVTCCNDFMGYQIQAPIEFHVNSLKLSSQCSLSLSLIATCTDPARWTPWAHINDSNRPLHILKFCFDRIPP